MGNNNCCAGSQSDPAYMLSDFNGSLKAKKRQSRVPSNTPDGINR